MLGLLGLLAFLGVMIGGLVGLMVLLQRFDSWRLCRGIRQTTAGLRNRQETPMPTKSGMLTLPWFRVEGMLNGCRVSVTPQLGSMQMKFPGSGQSAIATRVRWVLVVIEPLRGVVEARPEWPGAAGAVFREQSVEVMLYPALYKLSARKAARGLADFTAAVGQVRQASKPVCFSLV